MRPILLRIVGAEHLIVRLLVKFLDVHRLPRHFICSDFSILPVNTGIEAFHELTTRCVQLSTPRLVHSNIDAKVVSRRNQDSPWVESSPLELLLDLAKLAVSSRRVDDLRVL